VPTPIDGYPTSTRPFLNEAAIESLRNELANRDTRIESLEQQLATPGCARCNFLESKLRGLMTSLTNNHENTLKMIHEITKPMGTYDKVTDGE
jgi:hypothetical protein